MNYLKFYDKLNKSIYNIEGWNAVLAEICRLTGATKAIIALRDSKTAELIIPERVTKKLFSPLLFGFSEDEVASYITKYAQIDPWTEIERKYHPHTPYFLSTHLSVDKLKTLPFYPWLAGQLISDALIAKLDESSHDWVSLNLYFNANDSATKDKIKTFVREMLPALCQHWRLCRELSQYAKGAKISENFLSALDGPAILVDSKFQVIAQNADAQKAFTAAFNCAEHQKTFAFTKKISRELLSMLWDKNSDETVVLNSPCNADRLLQFTKIQNGEDDVGRNDTVWLITLPSEGKVIAEKSDIWSNEILTRRESEVIRAIAHGKTVPTFAKENDISVNTAKSYLRDARRKLGGISAKDIYASAYSNDT